MSLQEVVGVALQILNDGDTRMEAVVERASNDIMRRRDGWHVLELKRRREREEMIDFLELAVCYVRT